MMCIEEGGWIIPHFILTMGVLRFPSDHLGMCMGMLYSVDLGYSYDCDIRIPKIFKIPKISKIFCR